MIPILTTIYAIMVCIYSNDMTRLNGCKLLGETSNNVHFYRTPEECDEELQDYRHSYNDTRIKASCAVKDEPTWEPVQ
jgi:hypothetical protein